MFRQTHIKLTFLNSLVFIVLISILGWIIYFYTEHQLYRDVNQSLMDSVNHIQNPDQSPENGGPEDSTKVKTKNSSSTGNDFGPRFIRRDPRIMTLLWDDKNHLLIQPNRDLQLFSDNEKKIQPKKMNALQDVDIENYTFRYIAFKVYIPDIGKITVQVVRNIDSEKELLNRLLLIMIIGCVIGIICAVASGFFLARRALVPIKNSWQKQQQFVSDASHELRTPLAVIQAKTDLLFRAPTATIQEKIMDISTISTESRRLSKLVANLLTLARSDSDQIEVKKQPFQLDELLMEIIQHYEEIVSYQGKSLRLESPEPVKFFADKERIHQLIVILLDNAMKYTNEGGEILLSCLQTHSSIILRVKDNGVGIREEDIPKIFDRFFQSDKSRTSTEGTGLGLSIAKWIIEKHHGKTKVDSKLGVGTTIEMIFPRIQKS
ncbi:HAMP domain-containing histidine kinase [Bacillus sp. BRMEA1]|uniref:sensor histidine kinase n=1 Tax=Neobacillus endophyticus TaxID=2738405 RepID=UPI001565B1B3|nr:HAMP domain-containing sensor histidine kinase [Neobacillus endophyticus]NRD79259.1 HAMP domain-containing histidine kinase [Neobacillus endophyticus]